MRDPWDGRNGKQYEEFWSHCQTSKSNYQLCDFFFSCVCAVDSSWQISPHIYTNLSCLVTLLFVFLSPTFLALYNVFPEPYVLKTDGSYSLYFAESFMFFLKRFYVNF